jgi:hypothetical protein
MWWSYVFRFKSSVPITDDRDVSTESNSGVSQYFTAKLQDWEKSSQKSKNPKEDSKQVSTQRLRINSIQKLAKDESEVHIESAEPVYIGSLIRHFFRDSKLTLIHAHSPTLIIPQTVDIH